MIATDILLSIAIVGIYTMIHVYLRTKLKETKKIIRSANDIMSGKVFKLKTANGSFEAKKTN